MDAIGKTLDNKQYWKASAKAKKDYKREQKLYAARAQLAKAEAQVAKLEAREYKRLHKKEHPLPKKKIALAAVGTVGTVTILVLIKKAMGRRKVAGTAE